MPATPPLSKDVAIFLNDKPAAAAALFHQVYAYLHKLGPMEVEVTKTTIAFGLERRYCYIYQFGKNFISGVLKLDALYDDPEIFFKTGKVGGSTYVHHFRLYEKKDLSIVLKKYLKMARERIS